MTAEDIASRKNKLQNKIERISGYKWIQQMPEYSQLQALKQMLSQEKFTVVVLGEFSRGKSTFINALLGEALLPVDVLPETAVISAVSYGERPEVTVIHRDGTKERGIAEHSFLERFSAQAGAQEDVSYLQLKYPAPLLKNQIILVDTPGVSDLDEQRAEITYGFLPQADAVIFLLDATAPLKKTEREFILKRVVPQGIRQVIFVANKADQLDEEEDEGLEGKLRQRLQSTFGESCELFMISSRLALQGRQRRDEQMVKESQLLVVEARLIDLFAHGQREAVKLQRWEHIYQRLWTCILRRSQSKFMLLTANGQELQKKQQALEELLEAREQDDVQIQVYLQKNKKKLMAMLEKSLKFFHAHLEEEVEYQVGAYSGLDFKEFVETRLQRYIEHEIDNWLVLYGERMEKMVQKLGQSMAQGLARRFAKRVRLHALPQNWSGFQTYQMHLEAKDISDTDVKAGALAAAGGIGLTLAVGSALMPFASFVAMPFLRRKMHDHRLTVAKDALLPDLQHQLEACFMQLLQDLQQRVDELCRQTAGQVQDAYEELLLSYQQQIQDQMDLRQKDLQATELEQQEWQERLRLLADMKLAFPR